MTTIRFLAKIAGVAPSTVSRALRDDPSIGVKMRQHIKALAQEHHYRPNQLMQSLLTGQSGVIGMVLPRVNFPYCASMLSSVLDCALDAGYRALILETHGQYDKTRHAIHDLVEQRIDGILLYTGHFNPITRDIIMELQSHEIAMVGIDATSTEIKIDFVQTDETQLAEQAIDYLASLGHKTIAYIDPQHYHQQTGRKQAIMRALQKRSLSTKCFVSTEDMTYEELNSSAITDKLLSFNPRPTAIITLEDHMAAKVMIELSKRGLKIPDDISVMGCGNQPVSQFTSPQLTTVEQHPEIVGSKAFELLLSRMQSPEKTIPPANISIPPNIVIRESCGHVE
jgi:LacI family transcriptional regulator